MVRTARRLDAALAGRTLTSSDLRWPTLATVDLAGRGVIETSTAGKHLLTRIEGDLTLHSHLKMDGAWLVRARDAWTHRRDHRVRAVLGTAEHVAIGVLLGRLDLLPTRQESRVVGHLGPDVLGAGWDPAEAARRMLARSDTPLGVALLEQRVLAGVGTLYMAETCFALGLSPWQPAGDVDALAVVDRAHALMRANVTRDVQSTTGDLRRGLRTWVHGRARQPCRRCGTRVRVDPIGSAPRQRIAYWCPRCQPRPS